jgi:nucleoside 2-deoxyribosyltransferase
MIRRSRFLVSDLTGNRPGVYYESGFAAGLGLPVVWTCRKDRLHLVHFDNRQFNFILWEADHLGQFKEALQYRIEATVGQGPLNE